MASEKRRGETVIPEDTLVLKGNMDDTLCALLYVRRYPSKAKKNDDEDISSEGNSDEDTTEEDDSESGSGDDAQLEDDMEGVHLSSTGLERVRKALEDCPWIERGDSHYQTPLNPPEGAFPKVDRFFDAFSLILLQLPNLQSIELFFKGGDTSVICRDAKGRPAYLASTENNEDDDDLVEQARAWAASDDAVAWNLDL